MVRNATIMFLEQLSDELRIEEAALAYASRCQQVMGEWSQLIFQPLGDGHAETFLTAPPNKWRHQAFGGSLQNILRSVAMQFVSRRQGCCVFGNPQIQVRSSHL